MSKLSWNDIRENAIRFQKEWENETSESAEAKTFWDQFFDVFGISRRRMAVFEKNVQKLNGDGYVDLLWKGVMLVEHKSKGKDLTKAYEQAKDYFPGLSDEELPRYILVSDFQNFVLYDLDEGGKRGFPLHRLHEHIELFSFMIGYQKQEIKEQDPVNIEAAYKMGQLHDKLKAIGYDGHDLEVYLVRLLFCLFADDTGIFTKDLFRDYIDNETREDGSDLAGHIEQLFDTLNTPEDQRLNNLNPLMSEFPYVNGDLFSERLKVANFDREMRQILIDCSDLNWGRISPAIFGSLFQSVMDPEERRHLGAHYTSEENIMKVIKSLFLDDLYKEFERVKSYKQRRKQELEHFQDRLSNLTFLDPACGCGNFLIIAYRELRLLEIEVIREITREQMIMNIDLLVKVDVDQFHGIEIDEFASQISQVALWLIDHQMNMKLSNELGDYYIRLPLRKSANIVNDNALKVDWEDVVSQNNLTYILGNPPFVGSRMMTEEQKEEIRGLGNHIKNAGTLDFVSGWYIKAAEFMRFTNIRAGLVSTNSITQGEQAINLWSYLMHKMDVEIHFAHQTFQWNSEAKGKAAVFCVIIGFSCMKESVKTLYSYPDIKGEPTSRNVKHINQYLLDAPTSFVEKRAKPISDVPPMVYGSMPRDGGHLLLTEDEKDAFIEQEPLAKKYIRRWIGSQELVNGYQRYCLYLKQCPPEELRKMHHVMRRVESVRQMRLESKAKSTQKWADYPTRFVQDQATESDILIIPRVTSERRKYLPIGYFEHPTVASDQTFQVVHADNYLFGILNSSMHMAWMRTIGGRLKGDYRYSNTLVYNNFIFPEPNENKKKNIVKHAENIISIREKYIDSGSTFADLYDPIAMPYDLMKAHKSLDDAVDKAYRSKKFANDNERVAHLFELYNDEL